MQEELRQHKQMINDLLSAMQELSGESIHHQRQRACREVKTDDAMGNHRANDLFESDMSIQGAMDAVGMFSSAIMIYVIHGYTMAH